MQSSMSSDISSSGHPPMPHTPTGIGGEGRPDTPRPGCDSDHTAVDPEVDLVKRRLRMARRHISVSQREAAARAGISKSVLEKYESRDGERIPNTRQLFRLAQVYGLSVDYLLGAGEEPQPFPGYDASAVRSLADGSSADDSPGGDSGAAAPTSAAPTSAAPTSAGPGAEPPGSRGLE